MRDLDLILIYEREILQEGKKDSILFLKKIQIPDDIINGIIEMDITNSKNDSMALGKIYNNSKTSDGVISLAELKTYYNKFNQLKKKDSSLQITKFETFKQLEEFVDSQEHKRGSMDVEGQQTEDEIRKEAVYIDNNVEIYLATDIKTACKYGHKLGQSYPFCISRVGSGNMFPGYRMRNQSTFYFCKFKNRSSDIKDGKYVDPSHMVVLDVSGYNNLQWTWADNGGQGHGTKNTNWEEVLNTLPELKIPYKKDIFKNVNLSDQENQKLKLFQRLSYAFREEDFDQLSYDMKKEYIQSGYLIPFPNFMELEKELQNEYVNIGHPFDKNWYVNLTAPQQKRWEKVRLQIIEQGIN